LLIGQTFFVVRARQPPRGVDILSFMSGKNGETRRRPEQPSDIEAQSHPRQKKRKRTAESVEVGQALRAAYERTVGESIPPEMLDLLGKLG
jgi:hypothetical protein